MSWYTKADADFDAWVTGNWGEDSVIDEIDREAEEAEECAYCFSPDVPTDIPAVDDDQRWQEIAAFHGHNCEWVVTRAHRLEE